ncbi:peroxisomal testis-specific protein 1 [Fukomys damarensis]|uniref:peroxisomal testis-specific protein 1 n=1 Tax=Fukomys damarensis TaxID=885580 RepID=UPI0008FF0F05|nr:peroxisomal testis-specific protein 1 [Fukomys damarensis]
MGRLVFPKPLPAVTGSPDHNPLLHPKEAGTGQNPHQEEIIRKLATQLRHIGDGIHRRTTQDLLQEGRDALAQLVLFVFGRVEVTLRLFWNHHLL